MSFKFNSYNTLEYLSLHDCVINQVKIVDDKLIFRFDHIDVLAEHPMNPFNVAKRSGKAELIFEGFTVLESILYDETKIKGDSIDIEKDGEIIEIDIKQLCKDFEVLDVGKIDEEDTYIYYFFGQASRDYKSNFARIKIKMDGVEICWNEFIANAWFVKE